MRVKMFEVFQGRDVSAILVHEGITVSILEKGEEYDVDELIGKWLVENNKAVEIKSSPPKKSLKREVEDVKD